MISSSFKYLNNTSPSWRGGYFLSLSCVCGPGGKFLSGFCSVGFQWTWCCGSERYPCASVVVLSLPKRDGSWLTAPERLSFWNGRYQIQLVGYYEQKCFIWKSHFQMFLQSSSPVSCSCSIALGWPFISPFLAAQWLCHSSFASPAKPGTFLSEVKTENPWL